MFIHLFIHSLLGSVLGDRNIAWTLGHSPFPHRISSITVKPKFVSNKKNKATRLGRWVVMVRYVLGRESFRYKGQINRESMGISISPVKCRKGSV